MKKWEEEQRIKNYNSKIKGAKPTVKNAATGGQNASNKTLINKSLNDSKSLSGKSVKQNTSSHRQLESAGSNKSSISDYTDFEKMDLTKIPLYRVLKLHHLQQYAKELISRGYGYDLSKFQLLHRNDINILCEDIKMIPGHRFKFNRLLEYVNKTMINLEQEMIKVSGTQRNTIYGEIFQGQRQNSKQDYCKKSNSAKSLRPTRTLPPGLNINKKSLPSGLNFQKGKPIQIIHAGSIPGKRLRIDHIGMDFFRDSDDTYDDFTQTLDEILRKYQTGQKFYPKIDDDNNNDLKKANPSTSKEVPSGEGLALLKTIKYSDSTSMKAQIDEAWSQIDDKNKKPRNEIVKQGAGRKAVADDFLLDGEFKGKKLLEMNEKDFPKVVKQHEKRGQQQQNPQNLQQPLLQQGEKPGNVQSVPVKPIITESKSKVGVAEKSEQAKVKEVGFKVEAGGAAEDKNKIVKNIAKTLKSNQKKGRGQDLDESDIKLETEKIKNLYISFDSGKMTSTLINLDIEEMSYCLSCALIKHVEFGEMNMQKDNIDYQTSEKPSTNKQFSQNQVGEQSTRGDSRPEMENYCYSSNDQQYPDENPERLQEDEEDEGEILEGEDFGGEQVKKEEDEGNNDDEDEENQEEEDEDELEDSDLGGLAIKGVGYKNIKQSLGAISEKTLETSSGMHHHKSSGSKNAYNNSMESQNKVKDRKEREEEDADIDFEESRHEIENILRESLVNNLENMHEGYQHQDCNNPIHEERDEGDSGSLVIHEETINKTYDQYDYDKENDMHYRYKRDESSRVDQTNEDDFYEHSRDECTNEMDDEGEISFESKFTVLNGDEPNELSFSNDLKRVFEVAFNEKTEDSFMLSMPTKDNIANFCKNIIITSKMEKEVTIICLVYIERLIVKSSFNLNPLNWRRITFTALIIASKIWDDESYENDNFAKAFPTYRTKEINDLERVFLEFIEYNLYIKSSDYAKYYFILRTFAEKNKKSFPLRPLDLNTIITLQRNCNKASRTLKEMYNNPLNKTF